MHMKQIVCVLDLYITVPPFSTLSALYPSLSKSLYSYIYFWNSVHAFKNLNIRLHFFLFPILHSTFFFYLYPILYPILEKGKKEHICIFRTNLSILFSQKWGCSQEATKLMHEFYVGTFQNALRSEFHHFKVSVCRLNVDGRKLSSHLITL